MDPAVLKLARAAKRVFAGGTFAGWFIYEYGSGTSRRETRIGFAEDVLELNETNPDEIGRHLDSGDSGDWILVLAYEFGRNVSPGSGPKTVPDVLALRIDSYIAVSHATQESRLVSPQSPGSTGAEALRMILDEVDEDSGEPQQGTRSVPVPELTWRHGPSEYLGRIEAAQSFLRETGGQVLCLTNEASAAFDGLDALETYVAMNSPECAPRAALIETSHHTLISASPETFFTLCNGRVRTSPIKGTRRRGLNSEEDLALIQDLANDPKELDENRFVTKSIVSALEAVCEPGSVHVVADCVVETFTHVHQLTSTVEGIIGHHTSEHPLWCVLGALFPSVSMTGVPPVQTMAEIERLEEGRRGWYSGAFGWVNIGCHEAEFAVTIRTVERHGNRVSIGAGGGITGASHPDRELTEMRLKAQAPLRALRTSLHQPPGQTRYS